METVYNLWFVREYEDREDTELHIGIYATEEAARDAILQLRREAGLSGLS